MPKTKERSPALFVAVLAASLWAGAPASAEQGFTLALPVDCTPGVDCFLQNYFDADPGPAAKDFACREATYDGHAGADIRGPPLGDISRDVAVLAAAPGRVLGLRDGMADHILTDETRASIKGRECGNGVLIAHGGGWQTQYCHLKRGSIAVAEGDRVEAGALLGHIGSSGNSEFPHLELVVRKDGAPVDPFSGRVADGACGANAGAALWDRGAAAALYAPRPDLIELAFTDTPLSTREATGRTTPLAPPRADWPALVLFAHTINLQAGDVQEVVIEGPEGLFVETRTDPLDRKKAAFIMYAGRRARDGAFPAGRYVARYRLYRGAEVVIEASHSAAIE